MTYVKPSEIEKALHLLHEQHKEVAPLKAALFNLVVYIEETPRLESIHNLVELIIHQFPCRVLFIHCDPSSREDFLKTKVETKLIGSSGSKIFCDHVLIEVSPSYLERIPYLILPHLISDLPIYLFWTLDLVGQNPLFASLSKIADRLIFDSESSRNLNTLSTQLLASLDCRSMEVVDLNWVRSEGWREVIKNFFNTPERLQLLSQAEKIEIHYNADCSHFFFHNHIQAHYLHSWMAAQLKWTFVSHDPLTYSHHEQRIQVKTLPLCHNQLPPGMILKLEISLRDKTKITFIKEDEDSIQIQLPSCFPLYFKHTHWALSMAKEICYKETSLHYVNMLGTLIKLKELK